MLDLTDEHDDDAPTVLVVDDESEVRSLVAEILRGSGYRVIVAPDGDAAIALLERAHRRVDLLVTDVVMPVMSGTDLAARVTDRSPVDARAVRLRLRARRLTVAPRRAARRQAAPTAPSSSTRSTRVLDGAA